jgi:hypothetical protein
MIRKRALEGDALISRILSFARASAKGRIGRAPAAASPGFAALHTIWAL